jgi:hypothetical protein
LSYPVIESSARFIRRMFSACALLMSINPTTLSRLPRCLVVSEVTPTLHPLLESTRL